MKSKTQIIKDEPLTYEELTKLCKKKEEEIADLYKTIDAMSETNQCIAPHEPTYEELEHDRDEFMESNEQNGQLVMALEKSLVSLSKMIDIDRVEIKYWKEECYKLREKLREKNYDK